MQSLKYLRQKDPAKSVDLWPCINFTKVLLKKLFSVEAHTASSAAAFNWISNALTVDVAFERFDRHCRQVICMGVIL